MSDYADAAFQAQAGERLAALPGVPAVTLGGSRAAGTAGPDSEWDFAVYYRGAGFDPVSLRSLGWPGEISPASGWGGGVFNGGAWLTAGHRKVEVLALSQVLHGDLPRPENPAALRRAVGQAEALPGRR